MWMALKMNRQNIEIISLFVIICVGLVLAVPTKHLYVSPSGSDSHDGKSLATALKTLAKAITTLHKTEYKGTSVFIELAAGYHNLPDTLHINSPHTALLTIRALHGAEVHVTGGVRIQHGQFKHLTDPAVTSRLPAKSRNHVRVVHLPDIGITTYPDLTQYGEWKARTAPIEVFYNGEPMRLARWPNQGFVNIVKLLDGEHGKQFQYNTSMNEPMSWQHEDNLWAYGYWYWSWADLALKVNQLDAHSHKVTLTTPTHFGLRTGHWGNPNARFRDQGGYFKFLNVLSALDEPGEYYIDKSSGNLYVWLPNSDGNAKTADVIYLSLIKDCINVGLRSSNVVFRDFTLEACRGIGIMGNTVHNVQVLDMEIRNTGGYNVIFRGDSRNCQVARCYLHDGDGGVSMNGGSRGTLVSSGNIVEDNEIVRYSREGAIGYDGIATYGVGNVLRYNHIHQGQYNGIAYGGNNNVMEYNHVHHVCMNASDCGAIHTGRDWTSRGNIIRNNIVHHALHLVPGADVRGVMLDDQSSGSIITHNVFYKNDVHVNIGGGRDNIVTFNVMSEATVHSMQVDARGLKKTNDGDLFRHLNAVPYNSTIWTHAYPPLKDFLTKHPEEPRGNNISYNLVYNSAGTRFMLGLNHNLERDDFFKIDKNGFTSGKDDFANADGGDYRFKCYAATLAKGLGIPAPITPDQVGPRYGVGPAYKRKLHVTPTLKTVTSSCTTKAPATTAPMPAYIPDGSRPNDLVVVPKDGCYISMTSCTNHPTSNLKYKDDQPHTADNQTACLARAAPIWRHCGSNKNDEIKVVYGPTGAMTIAGVGCYMAMYGCPKHSGPADGHVTKGHLNRDTWAEQHNNALLDESKCLSRALGEWVWCGSFSNHPVTSLYGPTGAKVTAGAGCWISIPKCPHNPTQSAMFYDSWGATNLNTDSTQAACFSRAADFWQECGSNPAYPVTAHYRPSTNSYTYPKM